MKAIASPPADTVFTPTCTPRARSGKGAQAVTDLDQLIARILMLQPHDQVEMLLSGGSITDGKTSTSAEQRGYLMEIRVGSEPGLCVKRTF
jgi:hypothetical protein